MLHKTTGLAIFCLILCSITNGQAVKGYELTAQIRGLQDGEHIVARIIDPSGHYFETRDSVIVKNGEFKLTGTVPNGPQEYIMSFSKHPWGFDIIINNGEKITVHGEVDFSDFHHSWINNFVTVSGAAYNRSVELITPARWLNNAMTGLMKARLMKMVDAAGFDPVKADEIFRCIADAERAFSEEIFTANPKQNNEDATQGYFLMSYPVAIDSHHPAFMVERYNQLSPELRKSEYGMLLGNVSKLCVGQPFPDFTLPTPDGKMLALQDVVKKSRLTLVHFWGADSYMRKLLQDELRLVYQKYHDKGFSIIGFYSDLYHEQWDDILQKEKFPWYNVSDLKGKEGMAAKVYNEYIWPGQKIPNTTNVLIDEQGKIVAWDLYGPELQLYLWKYCK